MLSAWCKKQGAVLDNPPPVLYQNERISSSSRIRTAIRDGKLIDASAMLGRPFTILGQVVSGEGRGHGLGFPTANLATEDECLPPDGVYAGRLRNVKTGGCLGPVSTEWGSQKLSLCANRSSVGRTRKSSPRLHPAALDSTVRPPTASSSQVF